MWCFCFPLLHEFRLFLSLSLSYASDGNWHYHSITTASCKRNTASVEIVCMTYLVALGDVRVSVLVRPKPPIHYIFSCTRLSFDFLARNLKRHCALPFHFSILSFNSFWTFWVRIKKGSNRVREWCITEEKVWERGRQKGADHSLIGVAMSL